MELFACMRERQTVIYIVQTLKNQDDELHRYVLYGHVPV